MDVDKQTGLKLSSIIEQSKDLLNTIGTGKEEDSISKGSSKQVQEEVVALDKDYEEKSHTFAQNFL